MPSGKLFWGRGGGAFVEQVELTFRGTTGGGGVEEGGGGTGMLLMMRSYCGYNAEIWRSQSTQQ